MSRRNFLLAASLVVLAAFGLREYFVLTMTVPEPNQGDVGSYLRYAMHLAWDRTFSLSEGAPTPDAYRPPGYPLLLWSVFPGNWEDGRWFARIYQLQALLGAATVAGVIALARLWMSRGFALLAGGWMALQAHNIAATGAILTELLFGACIVGALVAVAYALERRSLRLGALAGVAFGFGYLVNPLLAFLPFLLAPLGWKTARPAVLAALAGMALAIGAWSARNAVVGAHDGFDRAALSFVQGSWPEYFEMENHPERMPAKKARMDHEFDLILADRAAGLRLAATRMSAEPLRYLRWYAGKPYLLFDWDIRIGHGTVYVITMRDTILDRGPLLWLTIVQWALNPLLFALALAGIVLAFAKGGASRLVAVSILYLGAVHVVMQAEPRYGIPYRALEVLLAFGTLGWLHTRFVPAAPATVPG